jgi:hypothetical protein
LRPHERFTPHLTKIHNIPFSTLVKQVCQKHPILQSYRIFLLSPELFSALSSSLSKNVKWECPQKPQKNGRLVPVAAFYLLVHPATSLRPGISCDKTPGYCISLPPGVLYGIPRNGTRDWSEKYQIRNGRWVSPHYQEISRKFRPEKQSRCLNVHRGCSYCSTNQESH